MKKLFSIVLEVPEDLDITAKEPVIDPVTGEQAFTTQVIPAYSYEKQVWNEKTEEYDTVIVDVPEEIITTLQWGE